MKITLSELKQMVRQELRNANGSSRTPSRSARSRRLNESKELESNIQSVVSKFVDLDQLTGEDLTVQELVEILTDPDLNESSLMAILGKSESLSLKDLTKNPRLLAYALNAGNVSELVSNALFDLGNIQR